MRLVRVSGSRASCRRTGISAGHRALDDWMAVENLEERSTALGWIDPRVLTILRDRAGPPHDTTAGIDALRSP
jgi:hypothetical protein